ncbi:cytochrome c biogenesis protein ResB [Paenibacillus hemerocallicola]|uniref:Cytochrome c biogenesis protein ResB n=1 Tax=Paenibacillus hemerocallicola TaxID=1172614 RepID=A0A5C4TG35_9BACL|nr:cytochrome c biogenesis protein ResB [Paenibacillus hemerocallicola]TNJ67409.1 cytochrome c biogenesis protein ResB [Paenibacillus hemerocallicola]
MIVNTKCECGHQNHVGTVLCESCGKPLYDDLGDAPLEMRYDGVARRSQKANPSVLDRVWNFFSSVKVAIYLILATLVGSILGSIYPQENTFLNIDPAKYYKDTYGWTGDLYYKLGLSDTYGSWWFIGLLVCIGTSLVICSLDRVLPLYRALSKQQIRKHLNFILRQKIVYADTIPSIGSEPAKAEAWVEEAAAKLRKKGYRVHTDGAALLAEKHRFSRWGPYVNHIGLIIFLLAVLMRGLPGWQLDEYVGFLEGEPTKIPETHYFLKNEQFNVEFYTEDEMTEKFRDKGQTVAKLYETKAVLYECTADCDGTNGEPKLKELTRQSITVNHPLNYKGLLAYQFDYSQTPRLLSVKPLLKNKQTGQSYGPFTLKMKNPVDMYDAGPYKLKLKDYFPDFSINDKGVPITVSNEPNAPAFVFTITGPGIPADGQAYLYFPREIDKEKYSQDKINGAFGSEWDISVNSMADVEIANFTSYLNIRRDTALPYIFAGAGLFLVGVVMGLYWQHRRIWIRFDEGNKMSLGAHTNKNWYGLRNEVAGMLNKMGIEIAPKQLSNEVNKT